MWRDTFSTLPFSNPSPPAPPTGDTGARFSKDPITYQTRKAIFYDLYLKKKAVYRR